MERYDPEQITLGASSCRRLLSYAAVAHETLASVSLSEIEGRLVPAQKNAAGRPILSDASIRGFTLGRSMVLTGVDEKGRDSRIVYSLVGYKQAITSMTTICGRPELAQKLVW